jgi:hypothetical protein
MCVAGWDTATDRAQAGDGSKMGGRQLARLFQLERDRDCSWIAALVFFKQAQPVHRHVDVGQRKHHRLARQGAVPNRDRTVFESEFIHLNDRQCFFLGGGIGFFRRWFLCFDQFVQAQAALLVPHQVDRHPFQGHLLDHDYIAQQ